MAEAEGSNQKLLDAFWQINRQIRRSMAQSEEAAGEKRAQDKLAPGQERLLRLLLRHDGISQKELAERMRIRPASLSEVLTKLEQKQLVTKEQDPDDRRRNRYQLTEVGKKAAEELQKERQDQGAAFFDILSLSERQELAQLLAKLNQEKVDERYL
ncbi:MarR family winged helix-turn-helix transcriptional regulator [Enterococcus sp. AD013-P3]|uniref:MarR family winged helix-turn-helix transcriptional regulator n=1 Tax=Enterococcus sp. AD013-P3 TaxID=3411036 RepID=UPI003B9634F0